jgi:hypothetical protein
MPLEPTPEQLGQIEDAITVYEPHDPLVDNPGEMWADFEEGARRAFPLVRDMVLDEVEKTLRTTLGPLNWAFAQEALRTLRG